MKSFLNRIQYNSPVILTFAISCTIIYLINYFTDSAPKNSPYINGILTPLFSLSPSFNISNPGDYIRLITYIFGHANFEHLLGNMSFVLLLGPIIEEKYGPFYVVFMMVITAVITGLLNLLFYESGIIGASGIVFMFIMLISFTNAEKGKIPLTFILIMFLFLGKELLNAYKNDSISQFGHIAGGIIGSLFGFKLIKKSNSAPPEHSAE